MRWSRDSIAVVGVAVAAMLACGGTADDTTRANGPTTCSASRDQTFADACLTAHAGCELASVSITPSSTVQLVQLELRATAASLDAIVGVASGDASDAVDIVASVGFAPAGVLVARDGEDVRADTEIAYGVGDVFELDLVIDVASATYSVFVRRAGTHVIERLASGYRLQADAAPLDRLVAVVASSTGTVEACRIIAGPRDRLVAARAGTYDVVPLGGGGALISDGTTTTRLDAEHRDVASIAGGGELAIDAAGNVYVARIANNHLSVSSLSPALSPRWNVTYPVGDGGVIDDVVVASTGQLVIAIAIHDPNGNQVPRYLMRLDAQGGHIATDALPADTTAIGLATARYVIARAIDVGVVYESYLFAGPDGWSRMGVIEGNYRVTTIAVAPDGSFAIAGRLGDAVTFGETTIVPYLTPDGMWSAFVVGFSPEMVPAFAHRRTTEVRGLATDGARIAVADERWTQLQTVQLTVYDPGGEVVRGWSDDALVGHFGYPGEVAIAAGRVYANVHASLRGPTDERWPFLVVLEL